VEESDQTQTPGHRLAAAGDRTVRPAWVRLAPFLGRPPALTRRQWRVLGLVAMASFFEMYDLYLLALTLKQIQADLAIPEASLGVLGSLVGSVIQVMLARAYLPRNTLNINVVYTAK
jgi:hypothetical protein